MLLESMSLVPNLAYWQFASDRERACEWQRPLWLPQGHILFSAITRYISGVQCLSISTTIPSVHGSQPHLTIAPNHL